MQISNTLYSRSSTGAVQQWSIFVEGDGFYTTAGQVGGKLTTSKPNKCIPKNEGKANATTAEQQAIAEAQAKYDKKLKDNYFVDINAIDQAWLEPMLCKPNADYIDKVVWPQVVDEKLNGVCCIVTEDGAKSRKNERFNTIPHILDDLSRIVQDNPSIYLHGELFHKTHVNHLNRIIKLVSVARKLEDVTDEVLNASREIVQFHVYDGYGFLDGDIMITAQTPMLERRRALNNLLAGTTFCKPVNWFLANNREEMVAYFNRYVAEGGEGVVIKNPKAPYEHKRTKNCLKYKKLDSDEFEVVCLLEGSGNWGGCVKMATCKLKKPATDEEKSTTFNANVKGTQEHLKDLWENHRDSLAGKMITVEFEEYSEYGKPLKPYTDLIVRNYE